MTDASELMDKRIKELADWRGKTLSEVRRIITEADPEIVEEWKWVKPSNPGTPVWSRNGRELFYETPDSFIMVAEFTTKGDSFVAGYLKQLLAGVPALDCLRYAMAAAASDASTLRPGFVNISQVRSILSNYGQEILHDSRAMHLLRGGPHRR